MITALGIEGLSSIHRLLLLLNTIIIIITLPRDNNFQVLNLLLGQTFP